MTSDSSDDEAEGTADDATDATDAGSVIEGFDDAVDGFHDVADQLRDAFRTRLRRARTRRRNETTQEDQISWSDALSSRDAFAARQDRVRENVLDALGGLPERPAEPRVEHRGRVERDGYVVERVVLETREDVHVTANCYVPTGADSASEPIDSASAPTDSASAPADPTLPAANSHPAVLLCTGHHPFPKADAATQRACIALARSGVVTLVPDAPGTGERAQYPDVDDGVDPVFHGSGVYAHSIAGQQAAYAGGNVARYFVHDARCALDYLEARDCVDPDRLGVTGTSGGGLLTLYLAVLDDRPVAIAPCCWVCDREHVVDAGFPIDHEQVLHGAVTEDVGVHDLATGLLSTDDPAPICVGAASSDFFPIEGVRAADDRIERAYALFDAADDCELRVADRGHAAVSEIPGVIDFLREHLDAHSEDGDRDPDRDPERAVDPASIPDDALLDRDTLQCTTSGSLREEYADERSLTDLVAADLVDDDIVDAAGSQRSTAGAESDQTGTETPAEIADRVRDCLSLDDEGGSRDVRVIGQEHLTDRGLDVERVFWRAEHDPPIVVTGVVVREADGAGGPGSDSEANPDSTPPAVVCFENGTCELPERTPEIEALAREHGTVLAFDPRGVGATRQRELPATWGDPDYHGVYGTTHTLGVHAALLGETLFAQRVADVADAIDYLQARTGSDTVAVRATGVARYHALYAAASATTSSATVASVVGVGDDSLRSFRERATDSGMAFDATLDAVGVLDCDVPAVERALDAAGVTVALDADSISTTASR